MSRQTSSVLCLIACTVVLWAAWRLTETGERRDRLPALQLWPFGPRPADTARPLTNNQPRSTSQSAAEPMPVIRVALFAQPAAKLSFEASEPFTVKALGSDNVLWSSGKTGVIPIAATAKGIKIGRHELAAGQIEIVPSASPALWVEGRQYRGRLRVYRRSTGALAAVNVVPLEDYVASVIDSEMPAAFPAEARKAQAIIARTYALYQQQVAERGAIADLAASTRSQKYLGFKYRDNGKLLAGETDAGREIARATRGMVCHYGEKLFCTYYCAVCGGSTVRGTEVFSDAAPPLVSVKCNYCRDARLYRWTAEIAKSDVERELQPWLAEHGRKLGALKTVSMVRTRPDAAAVEVDLRGDRQSAHISGIELRQLLSGHGIYSSRFTMEDKGRNLLIKGRGHGHGVGLCQWGARGQALAGKTCEQILSYYYPGTTLATRRWR